MSPFINALIATDSGEHEEEPLVRRDTKAPEGNGEREQLPSGIGGILGWLVRIGALSIPGFGPFIAATFERSSRSGPPHLRAKHLLIFKNWQADEGRSRISAGDKT